MPMYIMNKRGQNPTYTIAQSNALSINQLSLVFIWCAVYYEVHRRLSYWWLSELAVVHFYWSRSWDSLYLARCVQVCL